MKRSQQISKQVELVGVNAAGLSRIIQFLTHFCALSAAMVFAAIVGISLNGFAADSVKVPANKGNPTASSAATNAAAASLANSSTIAQSKSATAQPASSQPGGLKTATFAAGCYWGTEEFFRKMPGVVETRVGFTGGTVDNPKYEDTHDGHTGHAESVEIKYDPKKVSYEHLLDQFFKMHDPTTLNRQGNDVGSQYRSAIFYSDAEQKKEAEAFVAKVNHSHAWKAPVTTEIAPAKKFWPAEEDHQKYLVKNPGGYDNHYLRKINFDGK